MPRCHLNHPRRNPAIVLIGAAREDSRLLNAKLE